MTKLCSICGITELDDDDADICLNRQSLIMINKDISP
jgi:hypothetical protein